MTSIELSAAREEASRLSEQGNQGGAYYIYRLLKELSDKAEAAPKRDVRNIVREQVRLLTAAKEAHAEAQKAAAAHPPYNSFHEAHSVIEEEYEEAWDEMKKGGADSGPRDIAKIRRELTQLAAVCIRTMADLC